MSRILVMDFESQEGLRQAVELARGEEFGVVDAFTPYPVEGLGRELGGSRDARRIRIFMLAGGLAAAAFAYALQLYSATVGYPFDVGGRPHNSWPVFMLFPFEFGILAAALSGLVGLFWSTGLPALHHPVFDIPGIERASQDRFILAIMAPGQTEERASLIRRFTEMGALDLREVES